MASIAKNGRGWRAQIRRVGYPTLSKTFPKRNQAWAWALQAEKDLLAQRRGEYPKKTLKEALERFADEVAPTHEGGRWEALRCLKIARQPIAKKQLSELTEDDWALWREAELKKNKPATVRREMVLIGQVYEAAKEQWRWIPKNIMREVKKPSVPTKRPKRTPEDIASTILESLGGSHEVRLAYLLACETAMRPWEIIPLEKSQVRWRECWVYLDKTKNGDDREVPLTPSAIEILAELDRMNPGPRFFTVSKGSVTKLWADARTRAGLPTGIHFRHARREGIYRLSKRLPLQDLALAVGHRDLNSLRHYYFESAAEMAKRLQTTPSPATPSSGDAPLPRSDAEPETSDRKEPAPPDA